MVADKLQAQKQSHSNLAHTCANTVADKILEQNCDSGHTQPTDTMTITAAGNIHAHAIKDESHTEPADDGGMDEGASRRNGSEKQTTSSGGDGQVVKKAKRHQVSQACARCRQLKLKCTESRPCKRCWRRRDPTGCTDCAPFIFGTNSIGHGVVKLSLQATFDQNRHADLLLPVSYSISTPSNVAAASVVPPIQVSQIPTTPVTGTSHSVVPAAVPPSDVQQGASLGMCRSELDSLPSWDPYEAYLKVSKTLTSTGLPTKKVSTGASPTGAAPTEAELKAAWLSKIMEEPS